MNPMWTIANRLTRRAAAVALFACLIAGAARADELTVRIGYASIGAGNRPFVGGTLAATAHAAHYVEEELKSEPGVKIAWFFFAGAGPAVNEAFANGQLDFALQGDLPSVIGRANGLQTKILLASGVNTPIYLAVPPDSDIKTVADLKGAAGRSVSRHQPTACFRQGARQQGIGRAGPQNHQHGCRDRRRGAGKPRCRGRGGRQRAVRVAEERNCKDRIYDERR